MRILFDQGTPLPLRRYLRPHSVDTVFERGWSTLVNGELLATAERDRYDVFITTDQNLKHQQNLRKLGLGVVVLLSTSWPRIRNNIEGIQIAIDKASKGTLVEVSIIQ